MGQNEVSQHRKAQRQPQSEIAAELHDGRMAVDTDRDRRHAYRQYHSQFPARVKADPDALNQRESRQSADRKIDRFIGDHDSPNANRDIAAIRANSEHRTHHHAARCSGCRPAYRNKPNEQPVSVARNDDRDRLPNPQSKLDHRSAKNDVEVDDVGRHPDQKQFTRCSVPLCVRNTVDAAPLNVAELIAACARGRGEWIVIQQFLMSVALIHHPCAKPLTRLLRILSERRLRPFVFLTEGFSSICGSRCVSPSNRMRANESSRSAVILSNTSFNGGLLCCACSSCSSKSVFKRAYVTPVRMRNAFFRLPESNLSIANVSAGRK